MSEEVKPLFPQRKQPENEAETERVCERQRVRERERACESERGREKHRDEEGAGERGIVRERQKGTQKSWKEK